MKLIDMALAGTVLNPRQFHEFAAGADNLEELEINHGRLVDLQRTMDHVLRYFPESSDVGTHLRAGAERVHAALKDFQLSAHHTAVYDREQPPRSERGIPV